MPSNQRKERRTLVLLYVLVAYIAVQVMWWGYSLYALHSQLAHSLVQISNSEMEILLKKKMWMVAGEGGVFLIIVLLGFWYLQRTVIRELRLARMEKTFLLSVTHELKTPVAAIKLVLDTMRARRLDEAQMQQCVNSAMKETERLQTLSDNILLAARFDYGNKTLLNESVDLIAMLHALIGKATHTNARTIILNGDTHAVVRGDRELLQSMFTNLIENALKYSNSDSSVQASIANNRDSCMVTIADQGIGISDGEKKEVFKKFYRSGDENIRMHKGTGLGLYIAQNVVQLHKGTIAISNNLPQGTVFTVTLRH
ncbi:MAG: sensor histidine kinase [Flavobacteriales bacterium]